MRNFIVEITDIDAESLETAYPSETVTRRDAARRLISTAIGQILGRGDAVSANVLSWAAADVLRGVAKAEGIICFADEMEDRIKPEFLRDWRRILKRHYNYFKHADRDPAETTKDFRPEATTWTLFGACFDYQKIFGKITWPMLVYQMWFLCRHPEIVIEEKRGLVEALTAPMQCPCGKPLGESVGPAFLFLETGRSHPEIIDQLGHHWIKILESE